jgi:hypothetical protein
MKRALVDLHFTRNRRQNLQYVDWIHAPNCVGRTRKVHTFLTAPETTDNLLPRGINNTNQPIKKSPFLTPTPMMIVLLKNMILLMYVRMMVLKECP